METKKRETVTLKEIKAILKNLKVLLHQQLSPLRDTDKSKLFHNKAGFMVTKETEKYLLLILNDEKVKRNSFINECAEDGTRFSKPIKKIISAVFRRKTNHKRYQKLQAFETQKMFLLVFYI